MDKITLLLILLIVTSCTQKKEPLNKEVVIDKNSEKIYENIQTALINAKPGEVINLPEGNFGFNRALSLDGVDSVTIRGAGIDKTVLNFKEQTSGGEAIRITANNVTLEDFTVQDMSGDGLKILNSSSATIRRVKTEWTAGSTPENGAYGLYPVMVDGLLIENCQMYGAADAGIYTGQSRNVVLRNNFASENVQGIAVENCVNIEVYDNESTNNTVGISVYNIPNIPVKHGYNVKIYNNHIYDNNHKNFGDKAAIVGTVPAGTGFFVLAGDRVEVYNNKIENHQTVNCAIISYPLTQRPLDDSLYYQYTKRIYIHDNEYMNKKHLPDLSRDLGKLVALKFKRNSPDVLFDGIYDPDIPLTNGRMHDSLRICIREKNATFANLNAAKDFKPIIRDVSLYDCEHNINF